MRPFILRSLSRYAEKIGHEVAGVALDGAEAVERICEVQPDMVLLDLNMPEKDGGHPRGLSRPDDPRHHHRPLFRAADEPRGHPVRLRLPDEADERGAGAGGDAAHEMIAARETLL